MKQTPIYENRLISFVDLLGFSKEVEGSNNEGLPHLVDAIERFRIAFRSQPLTGEDNSVVFMSLSDSILRAREIGAQSGFYDELSDLAAGIVFLFAEYGYPARGAVTYGKFYFDKKNEILVSPSFITAFKLEKEAIHPRIVIDDSLYETFNKRFINPGNPTDVSLLLSKLVTSRDSDGIYFLDHLRLFHREYGKTDEFFPYMKKYRQNIIRHLRESRNETHLNKYIWLGRYFNFVLSEIKGKEPQESLEFEGLEIPNNLFEGIQKK